MSLFSRKRRLVMATAGTGLLAAALAGCKDKINFQGSDITGTHLGRDLAMVDGSGQTRGLSDYKGKVLIVFFGFTHCPDVCPTAMAELSQTLQLLKNHAKNIQVIMITVDPERDTAPILNRYVQAFDPTFVGLTGSAEQLQKTAQSFKAYYAKAPTAGGTYTMNHASSFYVLDQNGEARILISGNASAEMIAGDIKQLL